VPLDGASCRLRQIGKGNAVFVKIKFDDLKRATTQCGRPYFFFALRPSARSAIVGSAAFFFFAGAAAFGGASAAPAALLPAAA